MMSGVGRPARAWSLLVMGDERQFQGNVGYEDVVEESYSFDSTVANHRKIAVGDLVVLRDGKQAFGAGYVERLETLPERVKERRRCPGCGDTSFKERLTCTPRFRCSPCKEVFDEPRIEAVPVTPYRVYYGAGWQPLEGCLDKEALRPLYAGQSAQQSIRAMDVAATLAALEAKGVRMPPVGLVGHRSGGGAREPVGGRRQAVVLARRGQGAFRAGLIRVYGLVCAISGPAPAAVLEAAHVVAFAVEERHRLEAGLLLRADLHALFDAGMVAVRPDDLIVCVSPALGGHVGYRELDGRAAWLPVGAPVDREALRGHFRWAVGGW